MPKWAVRFFLFIYLVLFEYCAGLGTVDPFICGLVASLTEEGGRKCCILHRSLYHGGVNKSQSAAR